MRVLVVVPHYYSGTAQHARYGSLSLSKREVKLRALERLILALHSICSPIAYGARHFDKSLEHLPQLRPWQLDLKICTLDRNHLLDDLQVPTGLFEQVHANGPALQLGFFAHRVIREHAGKYDFYCYLEDDLIIHDSYFFEKLVRFNALCGPKSDQILLKPHRYELGIVQQEGVKRFLKVYPDFALTAEHPNPPKISFEHLNQAFNAVPANHPHSGCFFLTTPQLGRLMEKPQFGKFDPSYTGSELDAAASFAIQTSFYIFKASKPQLNFFELEHACPIVLDQIRMAPDGQLAWEF